MKTLLLIIGLGLGLGLSVNAQFYNPPKGWKSPELYLPSTILISTFATNHYLGESMSYGTRSSIAVTGIATSIATHFIFKKIRIKKHNKLIIFK